LWPWERRNGAREKKKKTPYVNVVDGTTDHRDEYTAMRRLGRRRVNGTTMI
jgi:hypothetical protein